MEKLKESEKQTLSQMLKLKINETHEVEDHLRRELSQLSEDSSKELIKSVLGALYNQRQNCYEIARKLDIK